MKRSEVGLWVIFLKHLNLVHTPDQRDPGQKSLVRKWRMTVRNILMLLGIKDLVDIASLWISILVFVFMTKKKKRNDRTIFFSARAIIDGAV